MHTCEVEFWGDGKLLKVIEAYTGPLPKVGDNIHWNSYPIGERHVFRIVRVARIFWKTGSLEYDRLRCCILVNQIGEEDGET